MIKVLQKLYPFLKPYRRQYSIAIFFMILVDVFGYVLPEIVRIMTDEVFVNIQEPGMVKTLLLLSAALFAAAALRGLAVNIMVRYYWGSAETIVRDIRNELYNKIQHMELLSFDKLQIGDLMSRITSDIQILRNIFAWGVEHRLRIILISATVFGLMLYLNWVLALLIFLVIPLFMIAIVYFSKRMRIAVLRKQKQLGVFVTAVQQNISGMRTIKAFSAEQAEIQRLNSVNENLKEEETGLARLQAVFNPLILAVNAVGTLTVLLYGGFEVANGNLSMGILLAFITYLGLMRWPISLLAPNVGVTSMAEGAVQRMEEILNMPNQQESEKGEHHQEIRGDISFSNVSFGYGSGEPVLENIDFSIAAGEKVLFFGLTGAGKSTLISLIPRFYKPTEGEIVIDGVPLSEWSRESLRSQIGFVHQETFLFSATIAENIRFGKPEASQEEIEKAANHAQIHDFIVSLPLGYETVVGEYGLGLSGGQRQRISLARTILQDPKILILDDCTSSLDSVTEHKIQRQLKELMKGRTSIIIAQRMGIVSEVDKIIVLNKKRIVDLGDHKTLLKSNRLYRNSFYSQYQQQQEEV